MNSRQLLATVCIGMAATTSANAGLFSFSTGDPDGRMATGSRPDNPAAGKNEIETGDDFIITTPTAVDHARFIGLLPSGATINSVVAEIYRVFPQDSQSPPSGNVPTRVNSPSDVAFDSRDSAASTLSFTTTLLSLSFTVANTVLNGINKLPNQTTGGEGPATGQEVQFDVTFSTPFQLAPDHYFFIPQVDVSGGDFLWLSAPRPIVPPGDPLTPDLQSWIRNENLAPDWLRIGTDIIGGVAFNAAFSLAGVETPDTTLPEPSVLGLLGGGLALVGLRQRRRPNG